MGEDSTRAEARSSATLPANLPSSTAGSASPTAASAPPTPPQDGQEQPLLIPSFSPNSAPSSPSGTLSRLGFKLSPTSPGGTPGSPTQGVSAITVVALLDKLVVMMEQVQENQRRSERRQVELEAIVRNVQQDVARLTKSHSGTSNSVNKLLERSRKTNTNIKEVRERLERQGFQVKRLEANHAHLLKRNHFKVLIFQEDNEIPSSLLMKDSASTAASLHDVQEDMSMHAPTPSADHNRSHEEGLHTISLTSDEDDEEAAATAATGRQLSSPRGEAGGELHLDEEDEDDGLPSLQREHLERSRAEKLKRSSLKKVDSLKKAFSRQSIEKKINKIVPPERREKIKKSFTPNHPKSPTAKSTTFHVDPLTFKVKKVRPARDVHDTAAAAVSPEAHVEVPSLGGPDGELPLAEVHSPNEQELNLSATGSVEHEPPAVNGGKVDADVTMTTATLAEEEPMPDHNDEDDDDDDENEEEEERASPVTSPVASAANPVNPAMAVEQVS